MDISRKHASLNTPMQKHTGRPRITPRNTAKNPKWIAAIWAAIGPVALSGIVLLPLALGGCDKMESATAQADREVEKNLTKSTEDRDRGAKNSQAAVLTDLKAAAAKSDASLFEKARAKSLLGEAQMQSAVNHMLAIEQKQLGAQRILWEIGDIGAQIGAGNDVANGYQQQDPKGVIAAIEKKQADFTAQRDQGNQKITALQADLSKRQAEIKQMEADKTAADTRAENIIEKAGQAKGEDSLKLFNEAQDVRRQSGELAAKLEAANASLLPIQTDITLTGTQVKLWSDAIKSFDDEKQQLQAAWTELSTQIAAQRESGQKLASEEIAPKAKSFTEIVGQIDALRKSADTELQDAINQFKEAKDAASKYYAQIETLARDPKSAGIPEQDAWKNLTSTFSSNNYWYQQAQAEQMYGNLLLGRQIELVARQRVFKDLKTTLDAAGAPWPADLDAGNIDQEIEKCKTQASAAFTAAQTTLEAMIKAPMNGEGLKNAANASLAMAQYGIYQVTGSAEDLEKAKTQASAFNIRLPNEALPVPAGAVPSSAPASTQGTPAAPDTSAPAVPAAPAAAPAAPAAAPG